MCCQSASAPKDSTAAANMSVVEGPNVAGTRTTLELPVGATPKRLRDPLNGYLTVAILWETMKVTPSRTILAMPKIRGTCWSKLSLGAGLSSVDVASRGVIVRQHEEMSTFRGP